MARREQKANIQFPNLPLPSPKGADILERERAKATFDVDELAQYIHGEEYLQKQDELLKVLQNEPLFDKSNVYYQGRDEKFRSSMAKAKRMIQLPSDINNELEV
jgi:acyl-CoA oxidase